MSTCVANKKKEDNEELQDDDNYIEIRKQRRSMALCEVSLPSQETGHLSSSACQVQVEFAGRV